MQDAHRAPPTEPRPWRTRLTWTLVVLLIAAVLWASVATTEWISVSNGSAQLAWNADTAFLGRMSGEFGAASGDLQNALLWENLTWGWAAVGSLAGAARLGQDGGGAPDAVTIASELNLTPKNFGCAAYGLTTAFDGIQTGQGAWTAQTSYLENMSRVSSELATRLRAVRASGTNPVAQLGPTNVTQIQTYAGLLYALVVLDFQAPSC